MNWMRELPLRLTCRAKRLDCGGFSTALRRTQRRAEAIVRVMRSKSAAKDGAVQTLRVCQSGMV